ncbi:MAG: DinB family protein [Bacteroidetes bacterium]|nr:DinB family protein [Bacteroidota bacterium]
MYKPPRKPCYTANRQRNRFAHILLNLYGDFYLPEIEKQMITNAHTKPVAFFNPGIIGNYFANLMLVKDKNFKKMKSPKDKNPSNSTLTIVTIDRFLKQQQLLKNILTKAKEINLNQTKTSISLTKLIKLKLGDTLRFYVYHIDRHIQQAEKITKKNT